MLNKLAALSISQGSLELSLDVTGKLLVIPLYFILLYGWEVWDVCDKDFSAWEKDKIKWKTQIYFFSKQIFGELASLPRCWSQKRNWHIVFEISHIRRLLFSSRLPENNI